MATPRKRYATIMKYTKVASIPPPAVSQSALHEAPSKPGMMAMRSASELGLGLRGFVCGGGVGDDVGGRWSGTLVKLHTISALSVERRRLVWR